MSYDEDRDARGLVTPRIYLAGQYMHARVLLDDGATEEEIVPDASRMAHRILKQLADDAAEYRKRKGGSRGPADETRFNR